MKTLAHTQILASLLPLSTGSTYSVLPSLALAVDQEERREVSDEVAAFLEAENPLGCICGVCWVMAFNAAVFALGVVLWESWKLFR